MSQIRFFGRRNREKHDNYLKQLRALYTMKANTELVYEFYYANNQMEIPDSVVAVRKGITEIAVFTPSFYSDAAALSVYVKDEAEVGKTILCFTDDDYKAAINGDSMRRTGHLIIKRVH